MYVCVYVIYTTYIYSFLSLLYIYHVLPKLTFDFFYPSYILFSLWSFS